MKEQTDNLNTNKSMQIMSRGIVESISLGYILSFRRLLSHPLEEVWSFITEPQKLKTWLAKAEIDLKVGGVIDLRYDTGYVAKGSILRLVPDSLLEYTWWGGDEPESVLRWELKSVSESATELALIHTFEHKCDLPKILSGWHVHLDMLAIALEGKPAEWSWENWEREIENYTAATRTV
jgi:uncharacterized protein YndB with AHSA1/START domain